jgi:hypothetical protein
MIKRVSAVASIVLCVFASLGLFMLPLCAQSFPMDGRPFPYAFQRGPLGYLDGTREGCRIYSEIAQSQTEENRRYRCGYAGARWDTNPELHFWWCRLVRPRTTIIAELRSREMDLERCLDRLDSEELRQPTAYGR